MIKRLLRPLKRRLFTTGLVIGVLALGLGTTLAVFAIAESVLVRNLPAEDPEGLVYIATKRLESGGLFPVRLHQGLQWRSAPSFESVAIVRRGAVHLQSHGTTERLGSAAVDESYFETLGVQPQMGRSFDGEHDRHSVLISHALWQRIFGGDSVLGEKVDLGGVPHTIIGVMPPSPERPLIGWLEVWTRLEIDEAEAASREIWGFSALGRLRDGATLEGARRDLETIDARLIAERPDLYEGWGAEAKPVRESMAGHLREPLVILQASALLVLLIACLTAGHLLFAITTERHQEMALRRALGARGGRLLGQLMAESAVIVLIAAALGGAAAVAAGRLLFTALPPELLGVETFAIGPRALTLTVAAAITTTLLCAGLSALAIGRSNTTLALRRESRDGDRWRAILVAAETTLATLAITGTLFLLISLKNVAAVAPGFDAEGLLTLRLELPDPPQVQAPEAKESRRAALEGLLLEIESLPGVDSAALAGFGLPLTGAPAVFQIWIEDQPRGPQPEHIVHAQVISQGFFETLGIPKIAGRSFDAGETWDSHHGVIVNSTFAERYFPHGSVLGRWIEFGNGEKGTIVGQVGDVHQLALERDAQAEIFLAWGSTPQTQSLLIRTSGEATILAESVRRRVAEALPGTPIFDPRTGLEIVRSSYQTRAVTTWTLGAFSALAWALGLIGVYGLVWHQVTSRRRDLGVRLAVGASPRDLVAWAIGRGVRPVAVGWILGLFASVAAVKGFESQLFGVEAGDPFLLAAAAGATLAVALLTALAPARQAAHVDVAKVLRAD